MRFPLTRDVIAEAERFALRSACCHCYFQRRDGSCSLGWPNREQSRWPLEVDGEDAKEIALCKEFELR